MQSTQVQILSEHIFFLLNFFIIVLYLLCQKIMDLLSTYVKFGVFKHKHMPTKVGNKSFFWHKWYKTKMKKLSKKNVPRQDLNKGQLGERPACCPQTKKNLHIKWLGTIELKSIWFLFGVLNLNNRWLCFFCFFKF